MPKNLLMPVLTGLSALALLINSPIFSEEKKKSVVGTVVKSGPGEIVIREGNRTLSLAVTGETALHLNERSIQLGDVQSGRKAKVTFVKSKDQLVARHVDVFPVPEDFQSGAVS